MIVSIRQMAETANELGVFAQDMGMQLSFHEHWGSFLQNEAYFHRFMELTDPNLVHFCCDTAQVHLSGWDEVAVMKRYAKRMSYREKLQKLEKETPTKKD